MRSPLIWVWGVPLAAVSSEAFAHDGGVVALIAIAVIEAITLGALGGALSGFSRKNFVACVAMTILGWALGIVILELLTDKAIAKNFWPNLQFLAMLTIAPLVLAYGVAHVIGMNLRRAKLSQEAPNSTAETDAEPHPIKWTPRPND